MLGTRIPIKVGEGKRWPKKRVQDAKLASEGGLIARHHVSVLPHFEEYKKDKNHFKNFIGKVVMDTKSEGVKNACTYILKVVTKNRRYQIKKEHFDNVLANQVSAKSPVQNMTDTEWQRLVKM